RPLYADGVLDPRLDLVSIDEINCAFTEQILQPREGFELGIVSQRPGVGRRAVDGDSEAKARLHVRGAHASADIGRTSAERSRFGGMGAACAKLDDRPPGRGL